ncbi:receptor-type tyrosine-protein phosphatase S-like isoform X2 [Penaeus japonicus]|uniref:receptor-type tyrosine-protein phosphatase S-like isoform X2 n=1 Tax=Penaeus japonicus TaxID=27405 RepID=UPI001C7141A8|nr:receptor-type tyrosine-protein phosphatase S-like isoform X2 [Penaeus japonicus]
MTSYYIPIVAVTTIILAASLLDLTLLGLEGASSASRGLLLLRQDGTEDGARKKAVANGDEKSLFAKPVSSRRRRQAQGSPWPPRGVSCTALNASTIRVSWSPPDPANVRGNLLGYRVLYGPSEEFHEESCTFLLVSPSAGVLLKGLTNDTHYSIQVMAYTDAVIGGASPAVLCRTPPLIPATSANGHI